MDQLSDFDKFIYLIIALNAIFSFLAFNNRALFEKYKFHVGSILQGKQYLRLLSSAFLHVNLMHLAFNMFAFWSFGSIMHYFITLPEFVLVYFVSLFAGNFLSLFYHKNEPNYSAVGASGAVSGVVFASILFYPFGAINFIFLPGIDIPSWVFGIAYLLYTVYGIGKNSDNIGHEAHLGGAFAGLLLAFAFRPELALENKIISGILLAIPLLILFIKPGLKGADKQSFTILNDNKSTARTKRSIDDLYINKEFEREKELNSLLEKVDKHGMDKLSFEERKRLDELSKG